MIVKPAPIPTSSLLLNSPPQPSSHINVRKRPTKLQIFCRRQDAARGSQHCLVDLPPLLRPSNRLFSNVGADRYHTDLSLSVVVTLKVSSGAKSIPRHCCHPQSFSLPLSVVESEPQQGRPVTLCLPPSMRLSTHRLRLGRQPYPTTTASVEADVELLPLHNPLEVEFPFCSHGRVQSHDPLS